MRATANKLTRCLVLGLVLMPGAMAQAGSQEVALALAASGALWGQPGPAANSPRSAKDLLIQARLAMQQGRFDEAERLIDEAEKAGGPKEPLVGRFEDSPERARRALAALREAGPAAAPAARNQAGEALSRYSNGPAPGAAQPVQPLLIAARMALAAGNVPEAQRLVAQAKQIPGTYADNDDSPQRVEALLREYQRLAAGPKSEQEAPQHHRQFAQLLLEQAEQLLAYEQFGAAEQLLGRARSLPVSYGPGERSPDRVMEKLLAMREEAGRRAAGAAPLAGGAQPQRLPMPGANQDEAQRAEARRLMALAQAELDRGNLDAARNLADRARSMNVQFEANETQPWQLLVEIDSRKRRQSMDRNVAQANFETQRAVAGGNGQSDFPVKPGVYSPEQDNSRVVAAQNLQLDLEGMPAGHQLYIRGIRALEAQDRDHALELFRQAWRYEAELDPAMRQDLKDKLTLLSANSVPPRDPSQPPTAVEEVAARQQVLQQQISREIHTEQNAAEQQRRTDPKGALNRLQKLRDRVNAAEIDPAAKKQFLTLVDRSIGELERYIDQHRAEIELAEQNDRVLSSIERDQQMLIETQDQLAKLVEEFNTLIEERRFAEAEIAAKKAYQIAPDEPVVQNLMWKSRFATRLAADADIRQRKEGGFVSALQSVEESHIPFDDRDPIVFGDPKRWQELTRDRRRMMEREFRRMSPEELEIQRSLSTKVSVSFRDVPLGDALKTLCDLAGVPLFIDQQGLAVEAVTTDMPINIELSKEISLKSALNLILEPHRLGYIIENDVLKVTSEGARSSKVYAKVYNVADLVIPIPNFVPGYNVGLPAAIREAHATMGQYGIGGSGAMPLALAGNEGSLAAPASVLAQTNAFGRSSQSMRSRPNQAMGMGPGGMGGAALADFDTLIELITSTVHMNEWLENGGIGTIEEFPTTLSLVISQTEEVHQDIADLLDQLRRLQDLQVTIEVRFITLNDDFFERIGVDFNFDIDDNTGLDPSNPFFPDDVGPSLLFGLDPSGAPTGDLDLKFTQDSFGAAIPQFGGFDANTAANFGFAILSDIEVFFLLQAAQGDRRSNVLQAPKVTLFNGQQASVADQSQRPFVTSIVPVVGDFAAAQAPVITVLGEGTSLSVQAVVSHDRRFVRLTLVPFFSQIGEVSTFTFQGKTSTDSGTNVVDEDGKPIGKDNETRITEGSTVQLPTFSFTTVSTTVNVPDGGTVLLGGIKRLSEGRNERGVPMLSKIPYVSRLFKNVGIGRSTQSLMLMVTPRIIIQEEEEARLGVELEP